jgi:diguanylate cyclase (GGDEF)-like protein
VRAIRAGTGIRSWPSSARLLILSSLIAILGFSIVCGSVMLDMRRGEETLAYRNSENLATTLDADIGRTVEVYDLSLRAVLSGLTMPEIGQVSPQMRHLILFDHAASASYLGALQVFDAQGNLSIDSAALQPARQNSAAEEFFKVHRADGERGLFISQPALYRGGMAIMLSRRITDSDGNFAGVVAGAIKLSYFEDLFGRLRLSADEHITVVRRDGVVVLRAPSNPDFVGRDVSKAADVLKMLARSNGSYSGIGAIDRIKRLYVWRDSGRPLVIVVAKPWAGIFARWQKQALWIGSIMLGLAVFITAVTLFSAREIGRRARAEDRLEELATTDALTGLHNRRKFDSAIDTEWRRAIRQARPLALLLIDADNFKQFNDTFGHQPGDQALVAIAGCIKASAIRAGDCAARYGGEEFAVLLPGVSAEEALIVAERIRVRVAELPSDPGALSVSIGVASMEPLVTMEFSELVEAADKALYASKAAGRNQSTIAVPSHLLMAA